MKNGNRTAMRIAASILCLLFSISLFAVGPAVAADQAGGTGPDDALAPSTDWLPLQPGETVWYAFQYQGDGSQVQVRLRAEPQGSVDFAVWTPGDIRDWSAGLEADPVGRSSPDPEMQGRLVWTGNFQIQGTYYVVVERSGGQPGTSYYLLEVLGSGVTLGTPAPTATPQAESAKPAAKPAAAGKPSGKLVFQTTVNGPFYVVNVDGTGLRRITDGMDATWSPDGKQIAFVRWREPRGVWLVNADGSGAWRVFDWGETRWPSWSPDGSQVLFSFQKGGRENSTERCFWGFCFTLPPHTKWRLGVVQPASSEFYEPTASQYSLAPAWSPTLPEGGSHFVYADEHGLRVQTQDGEVSYLITDDGRDTSPVWSPDGRRVAFTRRQHDHWEVYVVGADGRNLTRLTTTPKKANGEVGNSAAPAWSPDGQYLAFLTDRSGKWEIWITRADGSQPKPMFKSALDGLTLDYGSVGERAISWTK